MAFNAVFLTFDKKENSTKRPIIEPVTPNLTVLSVRLKESCSIINPVLQVYNTADFNPYQLNYCYIQKFNRYYFVNDWTYNIGLWECELTIDPLASFKTEIGNMSKYVLRSAHKYDRNIIDTFYPSVEWEPNFYTNSTSFNFETDIDDGTFIIGIASKADGTAVSDNYSFGSLEYYGLNGYVLRMLVDKMFPSDTGWANVFSGLTDSLYRAIYDPWQYIKSCKWFPMDLLSDSPGMFDSDKFIKFGNYTSTITAKPLKRDLSTWDKYTRSVSLPSGWLSLDAKYRAKPYAHIYLLLNPYGIIELDSKDFTDTTLIKLYIEPDFFTGDSLLKIYKVVGSTEYFITQVSAKLSVDIPLTGTSVDLAGMIRGKAAQAGGVLSMVRPESFGRGAISLLGGVADSALSGIPSISAQTGLPTNSIRELDGNAMLIYQSTYFSGEDNTDFGKPLYNTETLNTIPGFIKCADGHCDIPGAMKQETDLISRHLIDGFYYE